MSPIFVSTLCLLAVVAAAPVDDEQKTFPGWPNSFSATILVTEPFNTPGGALGEQVGKLWYDGEAGNLRRDRKEEKMYLLKNLNGRGGAMVSVDGDKCSIMYEENADANEDLDPFPSPRGSEFLESFDLSGGAIEKWQFRGRSDGEFLMVYIRVEEGVAIPTRFEIYSDIPPAGSDMILPLVVEFKDFVASKPDSSVFEVDAGKCSEVQKPKLN